MTLSWNDAQKHAQRRRVFNVPELKRLAAEAVNRRVQDVVGFSKLGEGGFNRSFLVSISDGFQFVARIPYAKTEPKRLLIASEIATLEFLRARSFPVPEVYGYSTTPDNAAGTEYILMELAGGRKLTDLWLDLTEERRVKIISGLVELESKLLSLHFPACGSLFHAKDIEHLPRRVEIPTAGSNNKASFSIGPSMANTLWDCGRAKVEAERGPCTETGILQHSTLFTNP